MQNEPSTNPDSNPIPTALQRIGCVSEFDDRPIDDETLSTIIAAAAWAPSAANLQPWEIIAVRSDEKKAKIGAILLDSHLRPQVGGELRRSWVVDAPLLLVVCLDQTRAKVRVGDIGKDIFGIQDSGAAIQNMRLVAQTLDIQSCLVREFDREQMTDLISLPQHVRPLIMIALGYSTREVNPLPRLPLQDYLHHENW